MDEDWVSQEKATTPPLSFLTLTARGRRMESDSSGGVESQAGPAE